MACEYLGHPQNKWSQRLGAQVGIQATDLSVRVQTTVKVPFVFAIERFFNQGSLILRRR